MRDIRLVRSAHCHAGYIFLERRVGSEQKAAQQTYGSNLDDDGLTGFSQRSHNYKSLGRLQCLRPIGVSEREMPEVQEAYEILLKSR